MAITATNEYQPIDYTNARAAVDATDKSILSKDDFMKLLLVELQNQDPTEPMDSEKILSQTSQLATLEASDNTTKALEELSKSLGSSQQFSNVAAIGRMADLGSSAISFDDTQGASTFELYFQAPASSGEVEIRDFEDKLVATLEVSEGMNGLEQFTWNGLDSAGNAVENGLYNVTAKYQDADQKELTTKVGAYPIESVRFEDGKTLVKVASSYVPLENIVEVY
ncbi:flagellar hook capping protein [Sulfurimonas aquatica]|uniref:Basal-body rod modification protein FlgD n=1 Tax=Sulfurimonas aquatica TaxID=2672570 RepID=A0A975AY02_9BACT|nr:flagellar hook capping FlgD N-terminal domain-containing protein [Sulfurimonas aquatica]QSZ40619.1 flagellar hook capping protein [Sulfurimonas aquatica]